MGEIVSAIIQRKGIKTEQKIRVKGVGRHQTPLYPHTRSEDHELGAEGVLQASVT